MENGWMGACAVPVVAMDVPSPLRSAEAVSCAGPGSPWGRSPGTWLWSTSRSLHLCPEALQRDEQGPWSMCLRAQLPGVLSHGHVARGSVPPAFRCSCLNRSSEQLCVAESGGSRVVAAAAVPRVTGLPSRVGFGGEDADEDTQEHQGLSERSQAVGAVLSLLLVALTGCLLALLLYKKERRETVLSKLTTCCRRSANVSYKYSKVNKEEEVDENETEWLMEEIQVAPPRPGKEGQENGHITTKSVKAEALTSLHGDDQDSEDEVLTIPEVRVHSARGTGPESTHPMRNPPRKMLRDDRVGLVSEKARRGPPRAAVLKPGAPGSLASFHDDSDEDLLNI
uniref:Insulin like growth factor 2 receptor n=1 Tax=Molossus molossus TaxID=27622 RepID=A0A7J8GQ82_MOLMO|nr:insulin like growth factor 2 receptor [Molossus molossus]